MKPVLTLTQHRRFNDLTEKQPPQRGGISVEIVASNWVLRRRRCISPRGKGWYATPDGVDALGFVCFYRYECPTDIFKAACSLSKPIPNQAKLCLIHLFGLVSFRFSFFQLEAIIRILDCIFMQKRPFFARKSHFFSADNHGIPAVQ